MVFGYTCRFVGRNARVGRVEASSDFGCCLSVASGDGVQWLRQLKLRIGVDGARGRNRCYPAMSAIILVVANRVVRWTVS